MQDKLDKLKDLSELLNSGIITQIEFETLKREVLNTDSSSYAESEVNKTEVPIKSVQNERKIEEEKPLMDGSSVYMKSTFNVKQGTAYLTTKRFLFGKRSGLFQAVAGPLFMHLAKGGNIIIDIEFSNLKSIEKRSHGFGSKYIFATRNGKEYALQFNRKQEQWLNSICEAAQRDMPNLEIIRLGDLIEFKL